MSESYGIVSCKGLGDGLVCLVLAYNLYLSQKKVTIYHDGGFASLNEFFPYVKIVDQISFEEVMKNEEIFLFYDKSSPIRMHLLEEGKKREKLTVLNSSFSAKKQAQLYYSDAEFDSEISMVDNLLNFLEKKVGLKNIQKEPCFVLPTAIKEKEKQVIFHISAALPDRRWPKEKFFSVARQLQTRGYEPLFVFSEQEKKEWKEVCNYFPTQFNSSLKELFYTVAESAAFIGNNSGVAHLASFLGKKSVTIFRNHRHAKLWRPGWKKGREVYPPKWILNIAPFRFRDRYWAKIITPSKVIRNFF